MEEISRKRKLTILRRWVVPFVIFHFIGIGILCYALHDLNPTAPEIALGFNTSRFEATTSVPSIGSRWFDLLLGPIFVGLLVLILNSKEARKRKKKKKGEEDERNYFGFVLTLFAGAFFGVIFGIISVSCGGGLGLWLSIGIFGSLCITALSEKPISVPLSGFSGALAFGLVNGLAPALFLGVVFGVLFGITKLIAFLISDPVRAVLAKFFYARDINGNPA